MAKILVRLLLLATVAGALPACHGTMDQMKFGGDAPGDIKN